MDEQSKLLVEMEATSGEDAVNTVEMMKRDLEYHINLVEQYQGLREFTPIWKSLLWVKCYHTASQAMKKYCTKGRFNLVANFILSYFQKLLQPSQSSATTTSVSQQPSTWWKDPPPAKR